VVNLYLLMKQGTTAGEEMKAAVVAACSADKARPLTDLVQAKDPDEVRYDVEFTYYMPEQSGTGASGAEIAEKVRLAVEEYTAWQSAKLGRDINPDKLREYLYQTGIKRLELTAPEFRALDDGRTGGVPQVARAGAVTIRNGGYEHE
jgi:phage-related baseplate assembly protein